METSIEINVDVIDEPVPINAPTDTDTGFLPVDVNTVDAPELELLERPQDARDAYPDDAPIHARADAYFREGGAKLYVSKRADTGPDPLGDALDRFSRDLGPGQVHLTVEDLVASQVLTGPGEVADWCWDTNRIGLLNGTTDASDDDLVDLAAAIIASEGGRNCGLWADELTIPGIGPGGSPRQVPSGIVVAGMIARNDRATRNPNLAAAGVQGIPVYANGIVAERTEAARRVLNLAQVNTFRNLYGRQVRNYGFLALADLETQPHWWDLNGARTVMAVRAIEQAVAEDKLFGQIDGQGIFLDSYETGLRTGLADLLQRGALFGNDTVAGYRVDVSSTVNPLANLADGVVTAQVVIHTSTHARKLTINIIRRKLTQEV